MPPCPGGAVLNSLGLPQRSRRGLGTSGAGALSLRRSNPIGRDSGGTSVLRSTFSRARLPAGGATAGDRALHIPVVSPAPKSPNLIFAVICERVMQEKDDVMSIIRVVDTIRVVAASSQSAGTELPLIPLNMAVGFRPETPIDRELRLEIQSPGDGHLAPMTIPMKMRGGGDGANVVVPLLFNAKEPGLYWIDVSFANRRLARVPLRVAVGSP